MLRSVPARSVWIASPDTGVELATMALTVGTGGSAVWLTDGTGAPTLTRRGRPVIMTEKAPGARGHFNIDAFYMKYEGVLQGINVLGTGIPQALTPDFPSRTSIGQGVADESIWGIELEASVSPTRNLTVSFNGAYTRDRKSTRLNSSH